MSTGCRNFYGAPKLKHSTMAQADEHAEFLDKDRLHKSHSYKCRHCKYWHAGRIKTPVAMQKEHKHLEAINEYLVGKIIAALKVVINK